MKTTKFFLAAACTFLLSTTAFAQTTPGTMQSGTSTGTMQSGTGTGTMNGTGNGTMQSGSMSTPNQGSGRMQDGSTSGRMDNKSKMNGRKGMKKTKTSTTPSSTGTM